MLSNRRYLLRAFQLRILVGAILDDLHCEDFSILVVKHSHTELIDDAAKEVIKDCM